VGQNRKGIPNGERGPCASEKKGVKNAQSQIVRSYRGVSVGWMIVTWAIPGPNRIEDVAENFLQLPVARVFCSEHNPVAQRSPSETLHYGFLSP